MSIVKDLQSTARRIFVTADTHFGHAEALRIFARPFADVTAMDDAYIEAINATVGPKDILLHLGDFLGPRSWDRGVVREAAALRERIACKRVYLVRGNHDPADEPEFDRLFEGVSDVLSVRGLSGIDERVVCFHYPIEQWQGRPNGAFHLHGHVHGHTASTGTVVTRRRDVGVDVDLGDGLSPTRGAPLELRALLDAMRVHAPSGFVRVK